MEQPTSKELANWFVDSGAWHKVQGADGFMYLREGTDYVYVWVTSHVDMDLDHYYLLDIRVGIGKGEVRHSLFVHVNAFDGAINFEKFDDEIEFFAKDGHVERLRTSLNKFTNLVIKIQFRDRSKS